MIHAGKLRNGKYPALWRTQRSITTRVPYDGRHVRIPAGVSRRVYRPVCSCSHITRSAHARLPAGARIAVTHTGCVFRPVCSCAHTGRVRAYRPRIPAGVLMRAHRPVCPCAPGRCAHAHPPAGVPMRAFGIRGHSDRCAHSAHASRLQLPYY